MGHLPLRGPMPRGVYSDFFVDKPSGKSLSILKAWEEFMVSGKRTMRKLTKFDAKQFFFLNNCKESTINHRL